MGMQCTKSTLKVAFIMSLEWIWDCASNPAPLIACSSNGINSSVASPSARLLLQMGYSSLSLLILLSVSVHCCISMIEGLAFLCFRTEKTVNIEVVTRISSKEPNNFLNIIVAVVEVNWQKGKKSEGYWKLGTQSAVTDQNTEMPVMRGSCWLTLF